MQCLHASKLISDTTLHAMHTEVLCTKPEPVWFTWNYTVLHQWCRQDFGRGGTVL